MIFDVEIVLKEKNYAVTEHIEHGREPAAWAETDVETVLKQILLAIDRVKNQSRGSRHVTLRGFSWIVEPVNEAGRHRHRDPDGRGGGRDRLRSNGRDLDSMIRRVIAAAARPGPTIH